MKKAIKLDKIYKVSVIVGLLAISSIIIWQLFQPRSGLEPQSDFIADADNYIVEGKYNMAIKKLKQQIEADESLLMHGDPANPDTLRKALSREYHDLGRLYMNEGKFDLAVDAFEKGIEHESNWKIHFGAAEAYFALQRYNEAIANHKKSLELYSRSPEDENGENLVVSYHQLAVALLAVEDYQGSVEYAQKVIEINPEINSAYEPLAESYYKLGEYEKAAEAAKRVIEKHPDNHAMNQILQDSTEQLADKTA